MGYPNFFVLEKTKKSQKFFKNDKTIFDAFQISSIWKGKSTLYTVSMYMKKKSPLTPFIWQQIREMEERGITNILYHRHRISEPNCKPIHAKGSSLGIEKMASLFVITLFGFFSSLIIFLIEKNSPCHKLKKLCYKVCSANGRGATSLVPISEKSILLKKIEDLSNELKTSHNFKTDILRSQALPLLHECNSFLQKR